MAQHAREVIDATTGEIMPFPEPQTQAQPLPSNATPLDLPAEQFSAALERRKQNRAALLNWVRSVLVEGTDYGRIHIVSKSKCQLANQGRVNDCTDPAHWSKPSLFKPGAEKICGMLGVAPKFPTLPEYESACLQGRDIKQVIIRCEIEDAQGRIVAHGIGARSLLQDSGDLNKTLKMAEKSSQIDATLRMAGLSEVFTQDLEDRSNEPTAASVTQPATQNQALRMTVMQRKRLEARIKAFKLDRERLKSWIAKKWQLTGFAQLSIEQYKILDSKLEHFAEIQWQECKDQPISKEDCIALTDTIHEHGISSQVVLEKLGVKALYEITHAQLQQAWQVVRQLQIQQSCAEYEALPEAEKQRLEAEAIARCGGTKGT